MLLRRGLVLNDQICQIQRLSGVDSDFAPFLQHAGIPSVDMYYGKDFPVYHTAFDSYDWMINHGDPLFHRHDAVAGLWGLLALRLADDPILPFNYTVHMQCSCRGHDTVVVAAAAACVGLEDKARTGGPVLGAADVLLHFMHPLRGQGLDSNSPHK